VGGPGPRLSRQGQDEPTRRVRLAVRAALLEDRPHPSTSDVVLVGVSGGADSLALLAATVAVAGPLRLRVHAVCVDHGWHRRTRHVVNAVARACTDLGADDVRVVRVVPQRRAAGGHVGGAEDAARNARLAALAGAAERDGALGVLLGHTLDDQAEQVLLGLARGSGARALAGMPVRRGPFVRPLLGLRRELVRAACPRLPPPDLAGLALPWHDPSNDDPAHLRARVRTDLLPVLETALGPGSVESLARSARLLRDDDDALSAWAVREVAALLPASAADAVDVPVAPLTGLPVAVRTRVLRLLASAAGAGALTSAHTRALDALVAGWHGQGPTSLPGSVRAWRATGADGCGRLRFAVDRSPREDPHGSP
jgi:tRNA(Ile)-lysidine synthase